MIVTNVGKNQFSTARTNNVKRQNKPAFGSKLGAEIAAELRATGATKELKQKTARAMAGTETAPHALPAANILANLLLEAGQKLLGKESTEKGKQEVAKGVEKIFDDLSGRTPANPNVN